MPIDIAKQRLHNQYLTGRRLETIEAAVGWLGAVQAQDYAGAKWALAQRTQHITSAEIDQLFNDGKILRTHVMRPTWHFVHPADIRWLLDLTAPRVHAVNAYYYRKFGLSEAILKKSEGIIAKALPGNQLTRAEIAQILKEQGLQASGLQLGYILMNAELNGTICSGALKGKQHTYALLDERIPKTNPLSRDKALVELARRYFTSHGPAQLQDFVWWSGLATSDAKTAVAHAELQQFEQDGIRYWQAGESVSHDAMTVHLLPNYDEYLIAYKDRSAYATSFTKTAPSGIFDRHILVVDGAVAGAWRETVRPKSASITITPLVTLSAAQQRAAQDAAREYGRFIGKTVEV